MNKPQSWASREEAVLLLNAYLDGELDAAAALDMERRMSADATLKAEYDGLLELRTALASHLAKDRASDALRQRITALAASPLRASRRDNWRHMAAAACIAASLASGGTYLALRQAPPSGDVTALVAAHQRALLAAAPFDVASSDRHVVKPWFDTKLALSPQVIDLASAGFPLAGGRVDLINGKPVPAMVYRRREHVVSLIAVPHPGSRDDGGPPSRASRDGYTVLRWRGRDFDYSAVADVAGKDLDDFVTGWRSEALAK